MEEGRPVDVVAQRCKWKVVQHTDAVKRRLRDVLGPPRDRRAASTCLRKRCQRLLGCKVCLAHGFVLGLVLLDKEGAAVFAKQAGAYRYSAAGIRDMHHGITVVRRNLDGSVSPARRSSADEQRDGEVLPLHLAGHVHHLIE